MDKKQAIQTIMQLKNTCLDVDYVEKLIYNNIVNNEYRNDSLDFNDIMSEKKQDNVDQINAILDSLSNIVIKAYENGVPIESIIDRLDNTIKGISSKEENKTKTLIRR